MADTPEITGRVTVGMVYRTVDDLKGLMDAHFDGVKTRLDALAPLPDKVAEIDNRLSILEAQDADSWRRRTWLISVVALLVSAAAVAVPLLS